MHVLVLKLWALNNYNDISKPEKYQRLNYSPRCWKILSYKPIWLVTDHDMQFSTACCDQEHSTQAHWLVTIATRQSFPHTSDKIFISGSNFDLYLQHLEGVY